MTRFAPLWQQAGSYSATLDRALLLALWPSGGAIGNTPTLSATTMQVTTGPGTCVVPLQAGQGAALCRWDANEVVTLSAAPSAGNSRIDLIVVQVRDNALDSGGNNDFIVTNVTGTAATTGSQVAPAVPSNAYALGQVLVPGGVANLSTATFTDRRSSPLAALQASCFRVRNTTSQAQANGVNNWNGQVVDEDTDSGYNPATGLYTVARPGLWDLSASIQWSGNATGVRSVGMLSSNAQFPSPGWTGFDLANSDPSLAARMTFALNGVRLNKGDTVNVQVYQNSGSTLNSGLGHFSGVWVAP